MSVPTRVPTSSLLPLFVGLLAAACFVVFTAAAWSYYALPITDRPFDARHVALRPSGRFGLLFGICGTALMVLNLSYLLRKRLTSWRWLGSLRSWMRFHVLTGLLGPGLVILHSGFAPSSALGTLSLVAMLVVVTTGIIGRFIYSRVPRSVEGHELKLSEVRRRLQSYESELGALGVDSEILPHKNSTLDVRMPTGFAGAVRGIVWGDLDSRRRFRRFRKAIRSRPHLRHRAATILPLARQLFLEHQWLVRYSELRSLMGSWRFFHRWLAICLFLVVGFHIALAVKFGALWIFKAWSG